MYSPWANHNDDYLARVFDCVAWQIARNGDELPVYFVVPPPPDAAQLQDMQDILTEFVVCEFDGAALPEIRYQGIPHTKQ
jgi:hypothetical protein